MTRRWCTRCGLRWAHGLCRTCERALGIDAHGDRRRALVARQVVVEALRGPVAPPGPPRRVTVEGRTFDVVWDGVRREVAP